MRGAAPILTPRQLPSRLLVAAALVTPGSRVADVGCDHGLLSIHMANSGLAERVLACDRSRESLRGAAANIAECTAPEHEGTIDTRLGDGLMALRADDQIEELLLCGLGVHRMMHILDGKALSERLLSVRALVLQPVAPRLPLLFELRKHVRRHGFCIEREFFSRDQGRDYLTLRATRVQRAGGSRPVLRPDAHPRVEHELLLGPNSSLCAHWQDDGFADFLREQRATLTAEAAGMRRGLRRVKDETTTTKRVEVLRRHERWVAMLDEQLAQHATAAPPLITY